MSKPWLKITKLEDDLGFGIELYCEVAPPGNEHITFGLGRDEAKELRDELTKALGAS